MSARSSLLLDGEIHISHLELDGALKVRATPTPTPNPTATPNRRFIGVLFLIASDAMLHKPAYTAGVVYACIIFVITAQFMSRRAFTKAEEQSILFTPFDIPITVQAMRELLISDY